MRLLHTSDWHLGKRLFDYDRFDVFEKFLDWLLHCISLNRIDTLVVAGDIFDTAVPTFRSQTLYYNFLSKVKSAGCRHVVVVAGNHDSPSGLDASKALLEQQGIYVIGQAGRPEDDVIELKDERGNLEAIVCAVPFLRERDIDPIPQDSDLDRDAQIQKTLDRFYKEVVTIAANKMGARRVPLIATGHLFTANAKTGVDESGLYIGSSGCVPASIFPKEIDYLALGHLHSPQMVGGDITRNYSGAPIVFNFDEVGKDRLVRIVDFSEGEPYVENHVVPTFDDMRRFVGNIFEIERQLIELGKELEEKVRRGEKIEDVLVEVVHEGVSDPLGLVERVRQATPKQHVNVLRIQDRREEKADLSVLADEAFIAQLDWRNVFEKRLEVMEEEFSDGVTKEQLWSAYQQAYYNVSPLADTQAY